MTRIPLRFPPVASSCAVWVGHQIGGEGRRIALAMVDQWLGWCSALPGGQLYGLVKICWGQILTEDAQAGLRSVGLPT